MLKKFFSYTAAEGLSKALSWLTVALLPTILNPKEYGVVGLLVAMEGLISAITLVGQEKAIFRFYTKDGFNVLKYSIQIVTVFILVIILGFVGFSLVNNSIFNIPIFPHFILFILSILFFNQARLLMAFSRITENAAMFWKTRALYQIIKIVAVGILAITLKNGLSYIYGSLIAGVAFFLIYIKLLYVNGAPEKLKVNIDSNVVLLLGFGVPLIFHAMSGNILTYADRFFVQGFLNSNQLGIYTFVYSLGSSIFFFYGTVASYFEPLTYRYHDNKFLYQTVLKFYLVFVLIFASVMAVLIKGLFEPVILKFVSHDYSKGADCLTFILAGYLMIPFYTIANYELAVLSKTKFIAISTLLAAVFNVTVNYFIIQRLGIVGAAISTFATYCFLALIVNLYARSKAGLDLSYLGYIVMMFLFVLCLLIAILYFKTNIIICSIVYVVILCIFSYFLFIEYRKLRKQISW